VPQQRLATLVLVFCPACQISKNSYNNDMNKSLLAALAVLLVLLLALSMFANVRFILNSRASSGGNFSAENSYLFASPLVVKANNEDKIRVSVFVLNNKGEGVPNQSVMLSKAPEILTQQQNSLTDNYGRAVFDLSSAQPGEFIVEALVNNTKLGKSLKLTFN